jgi:hypothetical protein
MTAVSYIIWTDIPAEREADFNEWYNREHAPDRVLGIPGFIQARRFVALEGGPRYAAWFDVAGPEVFRNEAYVAMRRTPDPRSRQFIPLFRNVIRFIGRPVADAVGVRGRGIAEGACVRFDAFQGALPDESVAAWESFVASLVGRPGILRARLFRAVPELLESAVSNMKGTTRESLRGPDRLGDALLMIEGAADAQIAAAGPEVARALAAHPSWTPLGSARMQQLMRVTKPHFIHNEEDRR